MKLISRSNIFKTLLYSSLLYFIYLLALITIQYIPLNDNVAFLNIKQDEIQLLYYRWAFFSHVYASMIVITLGTTQFSRSIREKFNQLHRLSGKAYIFLILLIASPTGLIMAYHANGGLVGQISFGILSVLWFYFTLNAFVSIKKRDYEKHRNFMIRSYALTLSAVSLRLFKYIIVNIFELPPMDTYKIVSVIGWIINIGIAELIIWSITKNRIDQRNLSSLSN